MLLWAYSIHEDCVAVNWHPLSLNVLKKVIKKKTQYTAHFKGANFNKPILLSSFKLKKKKRAHEMVHKFAGFQEPCKSKLQWGLRSLQSEWASSISLERILVERAWAKVGPIRRWWDDTGKSPDTELYAGALKENMRNPWSRSPTPKGISEEDSEKEHAS